MQVGSLQVPLCSSSFALNAAMQRPDGCHYAWTNSTAGVEYQFRECRATQPLANITGSCTQPGEEQSARLLYIMCKFVMLVCAPCLCVFVICVCTSTVLIVCVGVA